MGMTSLDSAPANTSAGNQSAVPQATTAEDYLPSNLYARLPQGIVTHDTTVIGQIGS